MLIEIIMRSNNLDNTRIAKRKLQRIEKKQRKNKKHRANKEVLTTPNVYQVKSKMHTNIARKDPLHSKSTQFENKFHELLKETSSEVLSGSKQNFRHSSKYISVEDQEIHALEANLGISKSNNDAAKKRLRNEYTKDGLGEDFIDFLDDLDRISNLVKPTEAKQKAKDNIHHVDNKAKEKNGKSKIELQSEYDMDMEFEEELDDETREELRRLREEDAGFLVGMDELPTDEEESDENEELQTYSDEDEEEENEEEKEAIINMKKNQSINSETDSYDSEDEKHSIQDDSDSESEDEKSPIKDKDMEIIASSSGEQVQATSEQLKHEPIKTDLYGRPLNTMEKKAYIPPHLRKKQTNKISNSIVNDNQSTSQDLRELSRRINGQLNRISDTNVESICLEMEKIYREYGNTSVNEVLLDKMLLVCCHPTQIMTSLIRTCASLIAGLYHRVGTFVGGFVLEKVVLKLMETVEESRKECSTSGVDVNGQHTTTSKAPINMLIFSTMLYSFGVAHCTLIYDLFHNFLKSFTAIDIELIHLLLKSCVVELRSDDPDALKEMVGLVQEKVIVLEKSDDRLTNSDANQIDNRIAFMLDVVYELKKPSKQTRKQNDNAKKELQGLRKWLGRAKSISGSSNGPLHVSLHELLNAEKDGRWWIVGGTWIGHQKQLESESHPQMMSIQKRDPINSEEDANLLRLAEKLRMNTQIRKQIFVAIMGAADCVDACERLQRLHLKDKQEREIIRVILHCSAQEKQFNPFYVVLGEKLCEFDPKAKFTFQLAFYDSMKQLDTFKKRKVFNLAQLLAGLAIKNCLNLSCLKVLDFTNLDPSQILFLQIVIEKILKVDDNSQMLQIFQKLKLQETIDGLTVFFHQHLKSFKTEKNTETQELMKRRRKMIIKFLDQLTKKSALEANSKEIHSLYN